MSTNREIKQNVVSEIAGKLSRSSSAILVEYIGLNVQEDTDLRARFRAAGVEYKVYKNTLIDLAAKQIDVTGLEPHLKGTTAVAISYDDPTTPARILLAFNKKGGKPAIKCGLVANSYIDAQGVEALSKVPAKEVLVAKLLGTMNAPITNFVSVLNGPARALVCALNAIADQKQQSA